MDTPLASFPLTSLTSWSIQHIHDIFEASSDDEALRALDRTFTRDLEASVNGKTIQFRDIQGMVLELRRGSRLRVSWQQTREMPQDPCTNRSGRFSGTYIIRGIQRVLPGSELPVEFERHKTVKVQIEPQGKGSHMDNRRIVKLVFSATDVRVHHDTPLRNRGAERIGVSG